MKNTFRCRRLMDQAIKTFQLNLSGLTVLTEAATGYYQLTPMIAALAGAKHVYALARDSRYATAQKASQEVTDLATQWGLQSKVHVLFSREDAHIRDAHIVTNLGFVRPFDTSFLRRLNPNAVIPLMWEPWEYRAEDLDLAECRRLGIPVLGTNEQHPDLQTFKYIGHSALKLLFETDIEVLGSTIVVIGQEGFSKETVAALKKAGCGKVLLLPASAKALRTKAVRRFLQQADALIVVEHISTDLILGQGGLLSPHDLARLNPGLVILHISGRVDVAALQASHLTLHPEGIAAPGHMSVTTDYVGPKALIDLHTAGLKVGEQLVRARKRGLSGIQAEKAALGKTRLAKGWPTR